jgi:hypothetical protein
LKGLWRKQIRKDPTEKRDWSMAHSVDGSEVIDLNDIEAVALPLYEGRMIGLFDFSTSGWVNGKGRTAKWRAIPWGAKVLEPQYLIAHGAVPLIVQRPKVAFMDVTAAINSRTTIATFLDGMPCGNSAPVLTTNGPPLILAGCMGSFTYDYVARMRCGGLHLNYFVIEDTVLVRPPLRSSAVFVAIERSVCRLCAAWQGAAVAWLEHRSERHAWRRLWALTEYERVRLRSVLDAVFAELYGLDIDDFAWLLHDCDYPVQQVCNKTFARTLDPKAFWRVEKDKSPELRHPVLSLVALHELKRIGLEKFLALNDGDGWYLPETLRLADYGLGHDARAKEHQPVAAALGERFLPWQLNEDVEASWEECRHHAELIGRIMSIAPGEPAGASQQKPASKQMGMFGNDYGPDPAFKKSKGKKR